jgi:transcriptional regulator with XRE-family HTH domain
MTYKTDKLQARITEKFGTQAAFAEAIGMDKTTLSKLISEGREWKGSKLMQAIKVLEIPGSEIDSYFFEKAVEEIKPQGT